MNDSGIKSRIDTVNMTPDANAKLPINNLLLVFFKYIGIQPNKVDNPAKIVKKKDIVILVI